MAPKGTEKGLALFLVVMLWNGAAAQSGCTSALISLSPCLNYVRGNLSTPSPSCCSKLSNVVQSQPQCLCMLLNGGASPLGITVNQTLALGLPGVCNVQTPPVSRCNAASAPTASAATAKSAPVGSPPSVVSPVGSPPSVVSPVSSPPPADSPESVQVGSPSPADSPSDSSNETLPENQTEPSESSNPSAGTGSKTVPSTAGVSSGGSTIKSPLQVAVFLLFIVSCASSATIF
ncbi:non-specific lipid transfer protein GPI-anchored 5-like isoform X2 [Rhododendron vialii]|uniref:non-specific lipid transfer protein GPI-anchored 5-like isoform X2 n=1 Tax=Rhododendron vialii TaxID=182163 RepID=UPI00265DF76B|nr:non-specific lipid transfer protein GPI-anchored 5-like isoform X2 [Rhododendron vialii]